MVEASHSTARGRACRPPALRSLSRALSAPALVLIAFGLLLAGPGASAAGARDTVTISGKAYRFNYMDTYIAGATIRVRERPRLSAVTDANGDYRLRVPDDANITPYIDPPAGYNEIDLQTLHTRGRDIRNANFQTPHDNEYNALAAILGIPRDEAGRPEQCVVVTTVSARNVRGVSYEKFHERTPHGVAGATARALPELPGPLYFNEHVIPDPSQPASSADGGIIWTGVPAGTYRMRAEHPETRFAPFLASCEPGRIVNANPPWGMYELRPSERALGASIVAASAPGATVRKRRAPQRRWARSVRTRVISGEAITVRLRLDKARRTIARRRARVGAERRRLRIRVPNRIGRGRAALTVRLIDATGAAVQTRHRVQLPGRHRR